MRKPLVWDVQPNGCWTVTSHIPHSEGYIRIWNKGRQVRAHRLMYEMANGPIADGVLIRHACDNRRCVNPEHLLAGTHKQNMRDMWDRGRAAFQREDGTVRHAKLTTDQVLAIRSDWQRGLIVGQRKYAKSKGISQGALYGVIHGRTWKHVDTCPHSLG